MPIYLSPQMLLVSVVKTKKLVF